METDLEELRSRLEEALFALAELSVEAERTALQIRRMGRDLEVLQSQAEEYVAALVQAAWEGTP